jgi:hypothetical protein
MQQDRAALENREVAICQPWRLAEGLRGEMLGGTLTKGRAR